MSDHPFEALARKSFHHGHNEKHRHDSHDRHHDGAQPRWDRDHDFKHEHHGSWRGSSLDPAAIVATLSNNKGLLVALVVAGLAAVALAGLAIGTLLSASGSVLEWLAGSALPGVLDAVRALAQQGAGK